MISMDKMDNYRETLEELLYNITVFSLSKRGLTLDEIEENFILSIYTVFEMIKMQDENLTWLGPKHTNGTGSQKPDQKMIWNWIKI